MTEDCGARAAARLALLASRVNAAPALVCRGRGFTGDILIEIGPRPFHVLIERGRVRSVEEGPFAMRRWCFALRAPASSWAAFWQRYPPPGFHDIFAMQRFGHCRVEGDIDCLLAHLRYVKDILAVVRRNGSCDDGDDRS